MTNQQILSKAISKAIENGWKPLMWISLKDQKEATSWDIAGDTIEWTVPGKHPKFVQNTNSLIFNHDFAKALWQGTHVGVMTNEYAQEQGLLGWKYHLQQMVIAPDPIKYLGDHLND